MSALLSPAHPLGFMLMLVQDRRARAAASDDLGASAIEWVIISALLIAIAIAVGAIILNKVTEKADGLDLNT